MTTIIFDCPLGSFSDEQILSLMEIYGYETVSKLEWEQQNKVLDNALTITEIPMLAMAYIPMKNVKKIEFHDAIQKLLEYETEHTEKTT